MDASFFLRNARTIAVCALIGLAVAAGAAFLQPQRHGATARLLVIPRAGYGTDVAGGFSPAGRIAKNLSVLIGTTDFFTKVAAQDSKLSWTDFGATDADRRAAWNDAVRTAVDPGVGLLSVTVRDRDADRAGRIAQAVADVLTSRGKEYVGGDIEIMLVDAPLVSPRPVDPNIGMNLALGLALGAAAGIGFVRFGAGRRR